METAALRDGLAFGMCFSKLTKLTLPEHQRPHWCSRPEQKATLPGGRLRLSRRTCARLIEGMIGRQLKAVTARQGSVSACNTGRVMLVLHGHGTGSGEADSAQKDCLIMTSPIQFRKFPEI